MRYRASLLINEIVRLFLHSYPDLRYIQALFALGIIEQEYDSERDTAIIIDRFYEEPIDTLKRCRKRISEFLEKNYSYKLIELNELLDQ